MLAITRPCLIFQQRQENVSKNTVVPIASIKSVKFCVPFIVQPEAEKEHGEPQNAFQQ
jgi:hypothetical protein